MKRTASCELQGLSPAFSAAIPARAVRAMYSFAFVDTVQRGSAFRQPYAGSALRRWQRQGLSPVNRCGCEAHRKANRRQFVATVIHGRHVVLRGFRMSDVGFRVIAHCGESFQPPAIHPEILLWYEGTKLEYLNQESYYLDPLYYRLSPANHS